MNPDLTSNKGKEELLGCCLQKRMYLLDELKGMVWSFYNPSIVINPKVFYLKKFVKRFIRSNVKLFYYLGNSNLLNLVHNQNALPTDAVST